MHCQQNMKFSVTGQSMWDIWLTRCQWEGILLELCGFSCQL